MIDMENRPVDPDNIQGCHRPISFMRIKSITRTNDPTFYYVQLRYISET